MISFHTGSSALSLPPNTLTITPIVLQVQKELLDAEMELFSKQQDGEDTTEHQQKVDGLRFEAAKMGIRGRGGFRGGRGRGFPTRHDGS